MRLQTVDKSELHAYLDGELDPTEAADLEERIDAMPVAQELLAQLAAQKDLVADALEALDPTVDNLQTIALEKKLARTLAAKAAHTPVHSPYAAWRAPLQAAAVVAIATVGWWAYTTSPPDPFGTTTPALNTASLGDTVPEFVSEAVGAHRVFAEDSEHAVEFAAASVDDAAGWFSEKLGARVTAPNYDNLGMELVGARLLGTKEGPMAQYLYEDAEGNRLSLTVAKHPVDRPEHDLQTVNYPDRTAGYWTKGDLDYAFVSTAGSDDVQSMIAEVAMAN
ncbi:MAG: hypothetical protein AAF626_08865 [Pseudomonadota bacterium]